MDITELLTFGVANKASDLHISSGLPPMLRINGEIRKVNLAPLDANAVKVMVYDVMNDNLRKIFEQNMEVDFAFEIPNVSRFRANVFMQTRGIGAVFRSIPSKILSLTQLNAPEVFREITTYNKGMVLVTGPTGSGKSTTLAAMVDLINETDYQHILTVEDPVEFVHVSKRSLVNQRELNTHTKSFANALKSALREDPDCVMVGEMRDLETISLALTAAETGHLVFGTLHTSSAAKTIDRIIDVFPAAEKDMVRVMLSESLRAVISQVLLKKKDGSGRVACHEIMIVNSAIKNLIRESKVSQINSAIQTGQQYGMQTMDQSLLKAVKSGEVSMETALAYATQKELFMNL
jgi:twitching motility protein PilT